MTNDVCMQGTPELSSGPEDGSILNYRLTLKILDGEFRVREIMKQCEQFAKSPEVR